MTTVSVSTGRWHGHCIGATGGYPPHPEKSVFSAIMRWRCSARVALVLAALLGTGIVRPACAFAQNDANELKTDDVKTETGELTRKARKKVAAVYPEVARRMSITGTVRLAVVVAPDGTVKSSKPVGGHPVLVNAAMDAMKRWRFEPAPTESSGVVEFKFQPQ
jgi:TonB family protein